MLWLEIRMQSIRDVCKEKGIRFHLAINGIYAEHEVYLDPVGLDPVPDFTADNLTDVLHAAEIHLGLTYSPRPEDFLTVVGVKAKHPEVTVYNFVVEDKYYSLMAGQGFDKDRLHDLFFDGEKDWAQYFNSKWYPCACGGDPQSAWRTMVNKVNTVPIDQLEIFVTVLTAHGHFIYDNFGFPLDENLQEAYTKVGNPLKAFPAPGEEWPWPTDEDTVVDGKHFGPLVVCSLNGGVLYTRKYALEALGLPLVNDVVIGDIDPDRYLEIERASGPSLLFWGNKGANIHDLGRALSLIAKDQDVKLKTRTL